MNISEAINNRHSVRKYTNQIIPNNIIEELKSEVEVCNHKSNLNIQLITNEPEASVVLRHTTACSKMLQTILPW